MPKVRLISMTKPVDPDLSDFDAVELMAYIARVSNPSNQMNTETAPKLLSYCWKNAHYSVFEHCYLTMEIETSRAIAAQILRHRSFVFQEFSQRYAKIVDMEPVEARRQDTKNRQNSVNDLPESLKTWFLARQEELWAQASDAYTKALDYGIAKECARFLLPLNTRTTLYMTGNVRSWLHYAQLRTGNGTQKEHMDIAQACKAILFEQFPNIAKAFEES